MRFVKKIKWVNSCKALSLVPTNRNHSEHILYIELRKIQTSVYIRLLTTPDHTHTKLAENFFLNIEVLKISTIFQCGYDLSNIPAKLFIYLFYLFIFRERRREREGKGEKHWLVASCMQLDQGLNPQPRQVLWPGIKLPTFHFPGLCSNNWATLVRAKLSNLDNTSKY